MSNLPDQQAGVTSNVNAHNQAPSVEKVIVELGHSASFDVDLSLTERELSLLQGLKTWHEASMRSGIVLGQPM